MSLPDTLRDTHVLSVEMREEKRLLNLFISSFSVNFMILIWAGTKTFKERTYIIGDISVYKSAL